MTTTAKASDEGRHLGPKEPQTAKFPPVEKAGGFNEDAKADPDAEKPLKTRGREVKLGRGSDQLYLDEPDRFKEWDKEQDRLDPDGPEAHGETAKDKSSVPVKDKETKEEPKEKPKSAKQ